MTNQILIRLDDETYKGISSKAKNENISVQSYIRNLINKSIGVKTTKLTPLIEKIEQAWNSKQIPPKFTTQDIKNWIKKYKIINDKTKKTYSDNSIQSLLANSAYDCNNKNLNRKVLHRQLNSNGVYEYWF